MIVSLFIRHWGRNMSFPSLIYVYNWNTLGGKGKKGFFSSITQTPPPTNGFYLKGHTKPKKHAGDKKMLEKLLCCPPPPPQKKTPSPKKRKGIYHLVFGDPNAFYCFICGFFLIGSWGPSSIQFWAVNKLIKLLTITKTLWWFCSPRQWTPTNQIILYFVHSVLR